MLSRLYQSGIKEEAAVGTEETLVAADFAGVFRDQSYTGAATEEERNVQRSTLTQLPTLKGAKLLKISRTEELLGGGAATAAKWHSVLKACGFTSAQAKVAAIGSLANATQFKPGMRLGNNATEGSATKTGVLARVSGGKIWYVPGTGTFASGDVVYGYPASGLQPSGTLSGSPANGGYRFNPLTETPSAAPATVTMELRDGEQRHTLVAGRGTGSLILKMNESIKLKSEMTGPQVYDTDGVTPRAAGFITGIPAIGTTPSVCKGMSMMVDGATPVLTMLEIDFGNTVTPRGTMASNDFVSSGYKETSITDRKVTCRIDPENVLAEKNWVKSMAAGTTFEMWAEAGSPADANGLVLVHAPAAQTTGEITPGDRNGRATVEPNVQFTGAGDDELFIWHLFG